MNEQGVKVNIYSNGMRMIFKTDLMAIRSHSRTQNVDEIFAAKEIQKIYFRKGKNYVRSRVENSNYFIIIIFCTIFTFLIYILYIQNNIFSS